MTQQNTTGEWTVIEAGDSFEVVSGSLVVARVGTTVRNGTTVRARISKADAHLIAAAPDMLEALRLAEKELSGHDGVSLALKLVRALIAKVSP